MKIKDSMIDKDLRATGRMIKIINNTFTEAKFRLFGKLKVKMRIKDDTIQFVEEWIPRKDGSKLRICIFKPLKTKENVPGCMASSETKWSGQPGCMASSETKWNGQPGCMASSETKLNDQPGVLWLHGGGYALGSPEQAKIIAKRLIEVSNCVVVAPDYRLSVEAPYPAALEDSYETLLWMKNNAKLLGIRDNQLMVGGDSAGGGLTAALTLYARDKGEVSIAFQMPLYPMLDDRMTSESAKDNNAPVWNSTSNFNGWKLYLGELFGTSKVPYYAAPARAEDYKDLPPTATFVGELEPFRDETIQYVENLRKAGVPVEFEIYKGCYHAFEQMCPKAEVSKKAITFFISSFKYAVEHYFAEQNISYSKDTKQSNSLKASEQK
jgi:acetyl esterase/lipase